MGFDHHEQNQTEPVSQRDSECVKAMDSIHINGCDVKTEAVYGVSGDV